MMHSCVAMDTTQQALRFQCLSIQWAQLTASLAKRCVVCTRNEAC